MKRHFFIPLLIILIFLGCATPPPYDYGIHNQGDKPDNELVTLVFDKTLHIRNFNEEPVRWGWLPETGFLVRLPAGEYSFLVNWDEGMNRWRDIDIVINVEPGKTYTVKPERKGLVLTILVIDIENGNIAGTAIREFSGYRRI